MTYTPRESLKMTAGYVHGEHNFIFQNLPPSKPTHSVRAVQLLRKLLMRGTPTKPSRLLLTSLDIKSQWLTKNNQQYLISKTEPKWYRTIRGADSGDNPAQYFFEKQLPKAIGERAFITRLIQPECPLNSIAPQENNEKLYSDQEAVDFYLPLAKLVIEVDGQQHQRSEQKAKDRSRDRLLKERGIETIRIAVHQLRKEGEGFNQFIDKIKYVLHKNQEALEPYKQVFDGVKNEQSQKQATLTAIIRFQLLITELLLRGTLKLSDSFWNIGIKTDCPNAKQWAELAIKDLFEWLEPFIELEGQTYKAPHSRIKAIGEHERFDKESLKIDLRVNERWTDGNADENETIFVRTDYVQQVILKNRRRKRLDHYQASAGEHYSYPINVGGEKDKKSHLLKLLNKLYNYDAFNPGQLTVISNILQGFPTIGLLPTGGGKSLCYQFNAILQFGCCVVVCPIRSLMRDQAEELKELGFFGRVHYLTSDQTQEERKLTLDEFQHGRLQFLFVSPERFQQPEFRELVSAKAKHLFISSIVVDEVHCLSEWGHDFRTSYLTLAKTIKLCVPENPVLCLTATASLRVLKDIQLEFSISDDNVCYLMEYSREELTFVVVNDNNNKEKALRELIQDMQAKNWVTNDAAGIIFTLYASGNKGCYSLANKLGKTIPGTQFFSGSKPKQWPGDDTEYEKYKRKAQDQFKRNQSPLLVATKAFGMGVNKPNVRFTIHYGIPSSMEALYQEAGRAGRDKQDAKCYILFSAEPSGVIPKKIHDQKTSIKEVEQWIEALRYNRGDFSSQLWFVTESTSTIEDELSLCEKIMKYLMSSARKQTLVSASKYQSNKQNTEKALYRLHQAGVVEDWVVVDYFRGNFLVDYCAISAQEVAERISKYIGRYQEDSIALEELEAVLKRHPGSIIELIRYLLNWNYLHFVFNRRQSLKSLYDACSAFDSYGSIAFKDKLENYFKVDGRTHRLQVLAESSLENSLLALKILKKKSTNHDQIISMKEAKSLQGALSRFLESYHSSPGLDLISGLLRVLTKEFDDADGAPRFGRFIERAKKKEGFWSETLVELAKFCRYLPADQTNQITEIICLHVDDPLELIFMHENFSDESSAQKYLEYFCTRMKAIEL